MPVNAPSLATYLSNPSLKRKYIDENIGADKIQTFVLLNQHLQLDILCATCEQADSQVDGESRVSYNGTTINGKDYSIWCIACDKVNHIACLAINDLSDGQAPFICATCLAQPENESAKALATSKRHALPLSQRLKTIRASNVEQAEREMLKFFRDLDVEFEFGRPSLSQIKELIETQREETEILITRLKESRAQNNNLNEALQAKDEEIKLLKINVKPNQAEKQQTKERKRFSSVIYAEDVDPSITSRTFGISSSTAFNSMSTDPAIEAIRKLGLNQLRNVLPIVKDFNGDPSQWLTFERSINLVQREGAYDNQFMKHIIRDKLKGLAAKLVDKLFDTHDWDEIMDQLRKAFGNPQIVVNSARSQVQEIKLPTKKLTQASLIEASTTISAYLEACKQANIHSHDRSLAIYIFKQLSGRHAEEYYSFFKQNYPHESREERLDVLIEFFDSIRDVLPVGTYSTFKGNDNKPKSFSVNAVSTSDQQKSSNGTSSTADSQSRGPTRGSSNQPPDAYFIKDIKESKRLGYVMDKVKQYQPKCLLCGRSNHFSIECKSYKSKSIDERIKFIEEKNLCHLCVVATDHQASQCQLRKNCGIRSGFKYCIALHHYSLHNRTNAKFGSATQNDNNKSQSKASDNLSASTSYQGYSVSGAKGQQQTIFTNPGPNGFVVLTASANSSSQSSPRTIKLFRTYVSHNGLKASTFTVGDSGAEISLVKRELVDELGISGPPATVAIQWTDESSKTLTGIKVSLPIRGILPDSKEFILSDCYAIDDFQLPPRTLNVEQLKLDFPYLKSVPFDSYRDAVPAILLGASHASLIEAIAPIWENGEGKPVGMLTKLGYTIYGVNSKQMESNEIINTITTALADSSDFNEDDNFISNQELSKQLEFAISLESLQLKPIGMHFTIDEKSAINQAENGLVQLASGQIQMPLIWRLKDGKRPRIPDNFPMVLQRQLAQERKLAKTPELLEAFNNNFKSEIDDGYIRAATEFDMQSPGNVNYVPMSLVVNANKRPIKTRNVYDASAKFKGTSLNANLLAGPNLLIDLLKPVMSMREHPIAFTGDIKSMFNRILIDPIDQNCQRLLWRENTSQSMQVFIKKSMLFGPTSSPFMSQFAKNWIADKFKDKYPSTSECIKTEVYMDDLFTSSPTIEDAIKKANEAIEIFAAAQMQLTSFQSNSPELLAALPAERVKKELIPLLSESQVEYVSKVLGVNWNTTTDMIVFELNDSLLQDKYKLTGVKPTKREQCSLIARIFDVMGLLAHCIIRARIILQHAWKKNIDWDQEVTEEDADLWSEWLTDLKKASTIQIPRRRVTIVNSLADADSLELHTFTDAGKEAIAAVIYMVASYNDKRESSFVIAKAKVAPLKLTTKQEITEMPRLELLAALIGARLATHVLKLHEHLKFKQYFWSDSEIVLRWIWNPNIKLPRFAVTPIGEILDTTQVCQWKYVDSKSNVADLATKFQSHEFGNSQSVWFSGPEFLLLEPEYWPQQSFTRSKKDQAIVCAHQLVQLDPASSDPLCEDLLVLFPKRLPPYDCALMSLVNQETGEVEHSAIMTQLIKRKPSIYFNWSKLVRATARVLIIRNEIFIPLLRDKKWRKRTARRDIIKESNIKDVISSEYIHSAELFLIRFMQRQCWAREIEQLSKGKRINNRELLSLNVFLDSDQVLRIRSRVSLPVSEYPQKYAPLIPNLKEENNLTTVILQHYHNMYRHIIASELKWPSLDLASG